MSELHHKALSVDCPTCGAPRLTPCDAPNKPAGTSHVARTARGVRAASRGDFEQHQRTHAALHRAMREGPHANDLDVALALAGCPCNECAGIDNALRVGAALTAAGVIL